jgi:prepilin signal peptidase PulO-like enzyme (type II secretory pathway)
VFVLLWLYSNPGVALSQWLNEIYNLQFTTYNPFPIIDLLKFILLIAYFVLLILIALHDAKTKYVLSKYVYIACALAAAYTGLKFSAPFSSANILQYYSPYFLSAIIPAGVFLTINKLSGGRAMGEGDAEVALTIGLILGWPIILPAYFFAFVFGAIYGITILLRKKGGLKSELPLGPFLVTGTIFAFFYGAPLINWYIGIFLGL